MKVTVENSYGHTMMGPEKCALVIAGTSVENMAELHRLIDRLFKIAEAIWDGKNSKNEK